MLVKIAKNFSDLLSHILVDKRKHKNFIMLKYSVRSYRGVDCELNHFLVITKLRESLSWANYTLRAYYYTIKLLHKSFDQDLM